MLANRGRSLHPRDLHHGKAEGIVVGTQRRVYEFGEGEQEEEEDLKRVVHSVEQEQRED